MSGITGMDSSGYGTLDLTQPWQPSTYWYSYPQTVYVDKTEKAMAIAEKLIAEKKVKAEKASEVLDLIKIIRAEL